MTQFRAFPSVGAFKALLVLTAFLMGAPGLMAQADPGRPDHAFGPSKPIPDHYIVVFKDTVRDPASEARGLMRGQGGQINFIYSNTIKGFAATLPPAAVEALSRSPNVAYIEQDKTVSLNSTQNSATWGLDRIDQVALPLNGNYKYDADGTGVTAYIIDTGILSTHKEFEGRWKQGFSAISDRRGTQDCNGHGTHVAGTVGGTIYGVAKKVTLVPVRVLDCRGSGSWSGVIAGIDWVAKDVTSSAPQKPAVANMSLGGGFIQAVNDAVQRAHDVGVVMVVAAGNSNADACNYSPAGTRDAITVGATTSLDARASYSNFGSCLDIFAPGSSITSAWHSSTTATNTISGTSMASPHVAGVAALVLQVAPTSTPSEVTAAILGGATTGEVTSAGTGSPDMLLHSLVSGDGSDGGVGGGDNSGTVPGIKELKGSAIVNNRNVWTATITATGDSDASTSGTWSGGTSGGCTIASGATTCSFSISLKTSVTSVIYTQSTPVPASVTVTKP